MKAKNKYQIIWGLFFIIVGILLLVYNMSTYDIDTKVVCVNKYKNYREHKGNVYYDDDNKMVVKHSEYGFCDLKVDITTYENHKRGDTLIFGWNQRELENHFKHYPGRVFYLHLEFIFIATLVLAIIGLVLSAMVPSDQ